MSAQPNNLYEIDSLIEGFLQEHQAGISTIHKIYLHNTDKLAIQSFIAELMDELRTGCVSFFNKDFPFEELNSYLFYIVNAFAKKQSQKSQPKLKSQYVCPGCLYFGNQNSVEYINKVFKCDICNNELKSLSDPKSILFRRTFFRHNKQGYHCQDCERFIPHPLDESPVISCPYFDCCFVGGWGELKRMHHPSFQKNIESLILDAPQEDGKNLHHILPDKKIDVQTQLEMKEELERKVSLLHNIIDAQHNSVPYNSTQFTAKHKMFCYQAFDNMLKKFPEEMVDYLLNSSRSGGFQHKVFQEYIRLLEESLPIIFKKHKKLCQITSLLDDNLSLFDGISTFEGIINDRGVIKNGTTEFYIGGRKSQLTKPFYIGKLLNILDSKSKKSLMDNVVDYTFSLIKMRDMVPGTDVIVSHLRVPPHYQMGGMVYVNRVRKKIIDRAHQLEKESNNE